ncbi:MAG: hypothetical protein ACOYJS_05245 [Acutalibacteraceae bacterium]|jgi:hypothetical protein
MFDDDLDFSGITGPGADLDGDGDVDLYELWEDEFAFQKAMGYDTNYHKLDDEDLDELDNDPDDDIWRVLREDEALEHGLDINDFDSEEEFEEALAELEDYDYGIKPQPDFDDDFDDGDYISDDSYDDFDSDDYDYDDD